MFDEQAQDETAPFLSRQLEGDDEASISQGKKEQIDLHALSSLSVLQWLHSGCDKDQLPKIESDIEFLAIDHNSSTFALRMKRGCSYRPNRPVWVCMRTSKLIEDQVLDAWEKLGKQTEERMGKNTKYVLVGTFRKGTDFDTSLSAPELSNEGFYRGPGTMNMAVQLIPADH
jgi:hypothetical protein